MTVIDELYGGDIARAIFGANARRAPAWTYVQHQGEQDGQTIVGLIGASKVTGDAHPLRYGSGRSHLFVVGEIIMRPSLIIGTDTLRGEGAGSLYTSGHNLAGMLADGELVVGSEAMLRELIERSEP